MRCGTAAVILAGVCLVLAILLLGDAGLPLTAGVTFSLALVVGAICPGDSASRKCKTPTVGRSHSRCVK